MTRRRGQLLLLASVAIASSACTRQRAPGPKLDARPAAARTLENKANPDIGFARALGPEDARTLDRPAFVAGADSGYADDEPVLGLVTPGGEARAYSRWQLDRTLIVNDTAAGLAFAVVADPLAHSAGVFLRPRIEAQVASLGVSGFVRDDALVIHDRETTTLYSAVTGLGYSGPRASEPLVEFPSVQLPWAWWRALHPTTKALKKEADVRGPLTGDVTMEPTRWPLGLASTVMVLGVRGGGAAKAYPIEQLGGVVNDFVGELPIAVLPLGGGAIALVRTGPAGPLSLRLAGDRLRDEETGSEWSLDGRAFAGPLQGWSLSAPPAGRVLRWAAWHAAYPGATVWAPGELDARPAAGSPGK